MHTELVKLSPPIESTTFRRIVGVQNESYCQLDQDAARDLVVAGVLGVRLFDSMIYPNFKTKISTNSVLSSVKMIASNRANVTYWPASVIQSLDLDIQNSVIICEEHSFEFEFSTYLHKDYLWAKDAIEAAYRKEFSH